MALSQIVVTWVGIVLSAGLAVAIPWVTHRRLSRTETLREMWLYWRRGTVVAGCVSGAAVLVMIGALTGLGAFSYPELWASVALIAGLLISVLMVLVRFVLYDQSELRRHIDSPSDEGLT